MRDEHIIGFDIAMDHPPFMKVGHPTNNLKKYLSNLINFANLWGDTLIDLGTSYTLFGHIFQQFCSKFLT